MFKLSAKILVAAAVVAVGCFAFAGTASAAWRTYYKYGDYGTDPSYPAQPQLSCINSGDSVQIKVFNPDVGGRAGPTVPNYDGSFTTLPTKQELVWWRATLYKQTSAGWGTVAQGPWWKALTGPFNPNFSTTNWWFNTTLQTWNWGGLTIFPSVPAGPNYAVVVEYYWGATDYYKQGWLNIWENDPCGYPFDYGG